MQDPNENKPDESAGNSYVRPNNITVSVNAHQDSASVTSEPNDQPEDELEEELNILFAPPDGTGQEKDELPDKKPSFFQALAEDEEKETFSTAKKVGCISCGVVLVIFLALMGMVTAVFYHYYSLMDFSESDDIIIDDNVTLSDIELSEIPSGSVEIEEGEIHTDPNVINILLIGTDERTKKFSKNARADSIMLLSLNSKEKTVRLVSLERGMLVSIPGRKDDILTHTFRYGGSNLLLNTVRTHFKVDVNKYVRVNLSMFSQLVDAVGGVDIELTGQEAYGLNTWPNGNTGKLERKVYEGVNHLNGYEALQYARLRWIDSDFKRIERQRKVIIAIKYNIADFSVGDLSDLAADCLPLVQTNLSAVEVAGLLADLPSYSGSEIEQLTIPKSGTYNTLGHVNFNENTKILNNFLYN